MSDYLLTSLAKADIFEIWSYIAADNEAAADRVEQAIYDACAFVAESPTRGHSRPDLTSRSLRFWTLTRYTSYAIVYLPETKHLQIFAVLHGKRNVQRILKQRPSPTPSCSKMRLRVDTRKRPTMPWRARICENMGTDVFVYPPNATIPPIAHASHNECRSPTSSVQRHASGRYVTFAHRACVHKNRRRRRDHLSALSNRFDCQRYSQYASSAEKGQIR
jgi:plasmid stabilization system protein ParE